jgi:Fe-S-cluster-containing dehydrogenase component
MIKTYALTIDHALCWGCKTCEVACKQENRSADGIQLISVSEDGPRIVNGQLHFEYTVNLCRHCDDPPCVAACPDEAIVKRADSLVVTDYTICTGCGICLDACPYDAITYDENAYVARKCNLCHHRVDQGLLPACADNVCPAHCIHFGETG